MAGTGVGLPAGAALIGLSAAVGAGAGAVTGAATGDSSHIVPVISTITHSAPAYETWSWAIVLINAILLLIVAVVELAKRNPQTRSEEQIGGD